MLKKLHSRENRIKILAIAILLLFFILIIKMFLIVLFSNGNVSSNTSTVISNVQNKRYNILDVNGKLLATTVDVYNFYIIPKKIVFMEDIIEKISNIFPEALEDEQLMIRLFSKSNRRVLIKKEITEADRKAVIALGIEAAEFEKVYARIYPYENIFSHIVGYVNINLEGVSGIERSMNNRLWYEDIRTSLDARVQSIIHQKLLTAFNTNKAKGAFAIAINLENGQVISSVSLPDFNPKKVTNPSGDEMINIPFSSVYQVGSVFKMLTIGMGLENGISVKKQFKVDISIPVDKTFTLRDEYIRKPQLTMAEILAFSSNVGSVLVLEEVGFDVQKKFFEDIGLFSPPKVELSPFEVATPIYRATNWAKSMHYTATYGYGVALSPAHFTSIARTLVSTGKRGGLTLLADSTITEGATVVSENTVKTMQDIMQDVVKIGTARLVKINGYEICAKTSTSYKFDAEKKVWSRTKKFISFFAFFPCHNPKYGIFMGFDEAKQEGSTLVQGGNVVAPLMAEIITEIAPLLNVRPNVK